MRLIYSLGIRLYLLFLFLASPFHGKARKFRNGRKGLLKKMSLELSPRRNYVWFHFASLGEFEQGRPVIEAFKYRFPEKPILLTFFSPSGYEIRKNYPLADHVYYLPADTASNARQFIELVRPEIAIFTKYEYWFYYFRELHKNHIPLLMISAIFRPGQIFFKSYGGFFRRILSYVDHYFVQDEASAALLEKLDIKKLTVAGDTRFDRVLSLAENRRELPLIARFASNTLLLVAGSTWLADEEKLKELSQQYPQWKMVIAPHEIDEAHLHSIQKLFPDAVRYSSLSTKSIAEPSQYSIRNMQYLIIDNIGLLSSLYAYADVAYIGGGFGAGIHNTLEAAAYGLPVIFGPRYEKFREARDLLSLNAGFSFSGMDELHGIFTTLQSEENRKEAGSKAADYVKNNAGATEKILSYITQHHQTVR
ncbi:3-deoxy-D-manno-octulosonic-acid transferase [bacterium A37T11]|nr:3-deoxy-D-manno-octulosonic-acid transferase [bacterium A37T11]